MGFFSWTCAKTNLPIMAGEAWGEYEDLTEVVLLTDGGRRVTKGTYDGYGRIFVQNDPRFPKADMSYEIDLVGTGLSDSLDKGKAKMVLAKFYDPKTDTFEGLGLSQHEPGQGYFHNEDFVVRCLEAGGFASYEGYCLAYEDAVPFELALKLSDAQARAFTEAGKLLAKAVLDERVGRLQGSFEMPNELPHHAAPSNIALIPSGNDPNQFSVVAKPRDQGSDEAGPELARLTLTAEGGSYAEAAKAVVDACPPERLGRIVFVRDFETVADVSVYSNDIMEHWYEVEADGRRLAFFGAHDVLDHFGIEKKREFLDPICTYEALEEETITFELPSQMHTPSTATH